jgi:hypothetical protein
MIWNKYQCLKLFLIRRMGVLELMLGNANRPIFELRHRKIEDNLKRTSLRAPLITSFRKKRHFDCQ